MKVLIDIQDEALDSLIVQVLRDAISVQETFIDAAYVKENLLPFEEEDLAYSEELLKALIVVIDYFGG